ncbi:hypothetical protein GY45DRAFT_321565 [Cubamyces sp. BRFM 1775]|nr:hypothetical protein GY45DRAFT_321565 [Cubamyces sp. BRFM 1775]
MLYALGSPCCVCIFIIHLNSFSLFADVGRTTYTLYITSFALLHSLLPAFEHELFALFILPRPRRAVALISSHSTHFAGWPLPGSTLTIAFAVDTCRASTDLAGQTIKSYLYTFTYCHCTVVLSV